ncbi:conjugal transfer protein TraN [Acinetobacter sp. ANC 5380]|uniref:Conjugal transfer protein TraN n=1 Tax=Acinetobacter terrae TaxID=2731247 RepID=A0A7Y2RCX8_9GAMM|nr:conjugal transfer protein TraN [Acinetobacter terrae]NNH76502.1 conjugal transfer protein TraN [Acinetobacter terrae]
MILQRMKQTLLATALMLTGGLAFAADPSGMMCTQTTKMYDTLTVKSQDRPITLNKTSSNFSFGWTAKENSSNINWVLEANLTGAEPVTVKIRDISYDDNISIYVNEQQVYTRNGGGLNAFDLDMDISQFFKIGQVNTIRINLINDKPVNAGATVNFEYSERSCKPIDYTAPVCVDGLEGDACIDKLNSFCSEPQNEKYKDCIEWKTVQEEIQAGANNSGTVAGGGGAGSGGMMGGAATGASLMFSPSAFAAQQAVSMINQLFTCKSAMSEEERNLPNRLNANLCIYVGEYCSKEVKILGAKLCRTKKKTYCCFNSTLSRIINQEGNKQLGRGMGSPKDATCNGFTMDEFSRLDLSKMDLTEFVDEVTAKANASAQKSSSFWTERNEARTETTFANVNTEDLQYKILTADNPYSVLNQPTDGKAKVDSTARTVKDETAENTVSVLETGNNPVNQAELDEAKSKFKNRTIED